jgi:quercetin dioxygenase-like cupin family protein/DNA-binding XRE family transcriptional regulator
MQENPRSCNMLSELLIHCLMDNDSTIVSGHLSRNMFHLRQAQNLSRSALASLAGLPRSTVTHIESGSDNPSLRNLIKLANGLKVSIEELLARPRTEVHLTRSVDLSSVTRSKGAARITQVLPDPISGMSIERVEIEAGGRVIGAPHVQSSKEYITVVSGGLEISVAGETHRLGPGDVIVFPGDQPHRYVNVGRGRVMFLSVVAVVPHDM